MASKKSKPAKAAKAASVDAPEAVHEAIHLPPPSYWPIFLALGIVLIAIGIIFTVIISAIGIVIMLAAIVGWTQENRDIALQEGHHE